MYKKNAKVPTTCKGCGKCCKWYDFIPVEEDELVLIPEQFVVKTVNGVYMKVKGHRCTALGRDNKCKIYKNRPSVCRDFVRGFDNCRMIIEKGHRS